MVKIFKDRRNCDIPGYSNWVSMVQRCTNPNNPKFNKYSQLGLCPSMRTYEGFYAVLGERPKGKTSIDRIDSSRGYFPDNIRWADSKEQSRNRAIASKHELYGKEYTLTELEEISPVEGLNGSTIGKRIYRGMSVEQAISAPLRFINGQSDGNKSVKHGMRNTKEYRCWQSAKSRCHNEADPDYKRYSGKGITMCELWRKDFSAFIDHMGLMPEDCYSLDRIDSKRGYEPGNCRWASAKEQARNKASNVFIEYLGKTMTIVEWSEETNIPYQTLHKRLIKKNWSVEEALTTAVKDVSLSIEYKGKVYSLCDLSRLLNINYSTLYKRIVILKQPLEQAIEMPIIYKHEFGDKMLTAKEISEITGIPYSTLCARIKNGKGIDYVPNKNKTFEYEGELLTRREISERTGIPYQTVINYLNKGYSVAMIFEKKRVA